MRVRLRTKWFWVQVQLQSLNLIFYFNLSKTKNNQTKKKNKNKNEMALYTRIRVIHISQIFLKENLLFYCHDKMVVFSGYIEYFTRFKYF